MPGGPLDAVLAKLSKRLNASVDQIIFSWVHSKGVVIVTFVYFAIHFDSY